MISKNTLAGSVGTFLEWAEFGFYAYLISKFSHLFFPTLSPNFAIFMALSTFAIGYISRPIGGIIFGYIGDKKGRKQALAQSIMLMGLVTLGIGLLPTYHSIGIAAPLVLMLLRFMQGLAISGEYAGAAVFVAEHDQNRTYLASSWVATFAAIGMLIGASAAVLVSLPSMPTWAWRMPFLLGAIGCGFGFYLRRKLLETALYQEGVKLGKTNNNPFFSVIKNYKIPVLKTAALSAFVGIYIYTCNIWWITFVIQHHYLSSLQAHVAATIGLASVVIFTPFTAILADFVGGSLLMGIGFIGAAIVAFVLFSISKNGNIYFISTAQVMYALFDACVTGCMFKYLANIFPTEVRYSGQAVGWNFAIAIFGGTAPMIAQIVSQAWHASFAPAIYVICSAMVALFANCLTVNFKYPSSSQITSNIE